jgi:hypothetical protein
MIRAILALGLTMISTQRALACTCVEGRGSLPERVAAYDSVFLAQTGTVEAVEPYGPPQADGSRNYNYLRVSLNVLRVWKGDVRKTATVWTSSDTASCGYPFAPRRIYLVFANEDPAERRLRVGLCSPTCFATLSDPDVEELNKALGGHLPRE